MNFLKAATRETAQARRCSSRQLLFEVAQTVVEIIHVVFDAHQTAVKQGRSVFVLEFLVFGGRERFGLASSGH